MATNRPIKFGNRAIEIEIQRSVHELDVIRKWNRTTPRFATTFATIEAKSFKVARSSEIRVSRNSELHGRLASRRNGERAPTDISKGGRHARCFESSDTIFRVAILGEKMNEKYGIEFSPTRLRFPEIQSRSVSSRIVELTRGFSR